MAGSKIILDGYIPKTAQSGIYSITHIARGKRYIGSSKNIYQRIKEHRLVLRHGGHCNPYLQKAWIRYGESAFKFEVIEDGILEENLIEKETEYIIKFGIGDIVTGKLFKEKGYNLCWPGKEGWKDSIIQERIKKNNSRIKQWNDLCYSYQCSIYNHTPADSRIPESWQPDKKTWDEMTYGWQCKLYKRNDPEVPEGWKPREVELIHWDQLSYNYQCEIYAYRKDDPRLPDDWIPKGAGTGHQMKDFTDLCYAYQIEFYRDNDPRVPDNWAPKAKHRKKPSSHKKNIKLKDFNSLSYEVQRSLYKNSDSRVPEGWSPRR